MKAGTPATIIRYALTTAESRPASVHRRHAAEVAAARRNSHGGAVLTRAWAATRADGSLSALNSAADSVGGGEGPVDA